MTQTLPIALDVGPAQGLSRYLQAINEAPMLSEQEEKDLSNVIPHFPSFFSILSQSSIAHYSQSFIIICIRSGFFTPKSPNVYHINRLSVIHIGITSSISLTLHLADFLFLEHSSSKYVMAVSLISAPKSLSHSCFFS